MGAYQLELYDKATPEDIKRAKSLLSRYKRNKSMIAEFEKIETLAPKQQRVYNRCVKETTDIERAVRLILDEEIRKTIEMRYIQGIRRKLVDIHFRPLYPSTVGRRLNEGIVSVANSLKWFE